MNWLLVLSALFSTLTGVNMGVRPIDVAVQQTAFATSVRHNAAVAMPIARGHAHLLGAFGSVAGFAVAPALSVPTLGTPRLYLDRPRA